MLWAYKQVFKAVAPPLPFLQLPSVGLTPLFLSCPLAPSCLSLLIQLTSLVHYFSHSLTLPFHLIHVTSPIPGRIQHSTFSEPAPGQQHSVREKAHIQALQIYHHLSSLGYQYHLTILAFSS